MKKCMYFKLFLNYLIYKKNVYILNYLGFFLLYSFKLVRQNPLFPFKMLN